MIPPVRHVCPEGRFSQIQGWHRETGWLERGGQWELPLWKPLRTPAVWREGCMGKIDVAFVVEIYQSNNVQRGLLYWIVANISVTISGGCTSIWRGPRDLGILIKLYQVTYYKFELCEMKGRSGFGLIDTWKVHPIQPWLDGSFREN